MFDKAIKYEISTITNYRFALKRTFNIQKGKKKGRPSVAQVKLLYTKDIISK